MFARGLRNPKSAGFHPETGRLCVGNVGWFLNEGIYCLDAGDNTGWPCRENGPARNGYTTLALDRDGERLASCPLRPGEWVEPDFAYPHQPVEIGGETLSVGAVIGCAIADAAEYPDDFNGSCVYGDYVFDTLSSVRLDGRGANPSSTLQVAEAGLPTDVETDPEGRVCWIAYEVGTADGTSVSEIRCLRHDASGAVAQYPVVSFDSVPEADEPLGLFFDASDSYHTGGEPLVHRWNFGDGRTATGETALHVYAEPGDYTVRLTSRARGSSVRRSTSQDVRLDDPTRVAPILPVVEDIEFAHDEHFVSGEVPFGVRIRNDRGDEPFHVLVNIYDEDGGEVAHLVRARTDPARRRGDDDRRLPVGQRGQDRRVHDGGRVLRRGLGQLDAEVPPRVALSRAHEGQRRGRAAGRPTRRRGDARAADARLAGGGADRIGRNTGLRAEHRSGLDDGRARVGRRSRRRPRRREPGHADALSRRDGRVGRVRVADGVAVAGVRRAAAAGGDRPRVARVEVRQSSFSGSWPQFISE